MSHGYVELHHGFRFFWSMEGEKIPEICGHTEYPGGAIVRGSGGWFRTTDPTFAAQIAQVNLPNLLEEGS